MHGWGKFLFPNGNVYDGNYSNDKREGKKKNFDVCALSLLNSNARSRSLGSGFGTLSYAEGHRYEGQWHEDSAHGEGTLIYANQDTYKGNWAR